MKDKDFNPFLFPSALPNHSNPYISSSSTLPSPSQASASLDSPLKSSSFAPSPSYSSVVPSSASAVAPGPCAACKLLGHQCTDKCSTSTYPLDESEWLTIVDRLFGGQASTIINFVKETKMIGKALQGYIFLLGSGAILWSLKKQSIVTLLIIEAELIAATSYVCQAIWLKKNLEEVCFKQEKAVTIYCDNNSTMKLS